MKSLKYIVLLLAIVSLPFALSATGQKEVTDTSTLQVVVSIMPQAYAVEQIAGDLVKVTTLVGDGQSPHNYETTPRQMADLANAQVWFLSGTDFENALLPKITALYPDLLIVDGTEGVTFRLLEEHDHELESDGHEEEVDSMAYDKHTWLSKEPYIIQITHIRDTLTSLDAENADTYKQNAQLFIDKIEELFSNLKQELKPLSGSTVFVFHPAFGYFLDEFNITQEAVETGGKEPTARTLTTLIEEAQKDQVKAIFVQEQFPKEAAQSIADAVGARVLALDSLAYNWLENIQKMGNTLLEASKL
jgi:zinc transport system substrate-binding protein